MYSFPNLEPVCCPMSSSNCYFLTCIQISQEAGKAVWYSHLLKNFPQFIVICTVKGFGINNEAEIDGFLEFSCFFCDPTNVGSFISGYSAFCKFSLNLWKFSVHVLSKPGLGALCLTLPVWNEYSCAVVWGFFAEGGGNLLQYSCLGNSIGYSPWGRKESDTTEWLQFSLSILWHCPSFMLEWKLTFSNPMAAAEFSKFVGILSTALSQHHLLGHEIAQLEFLHLH